jgi:DNA-binding PadR family transcriptional regulator
MFRYSVLGLLRDQKPRHGYALMKEYGERSGTRIGTGSFYRELARLVAEGLVTTADRSPDADPRQAPYRISGRGIAVFDAWLAGPHEATAGMHDDELSVVALFLTRASRETVDALFRSLQDEFWMRSKAFERARETAARRQASAGSGETLDVLDLLLGRRQKHVAAEIQFLEDLRTSYRSWAERQAPCGRAEESTTTSRNLTRKPRSDVR